MISPLRKKYHALYWDMAIAASHSSYARKAKVGAIVVTPTGMISPGWNGMPSGMGNDCEFYNEELKAWKTKPEVIHAEANALDKMAREGVPAKGSVIFVTRVPCINCAKSLLGIGISAVYYIEPHRKMNGAELLKRAGIHVEYHGDKFPEVMRFL